MLVDDNWKKKSAAWKILVYTFTLPGKFFGAMMISDVLVMKVKLILSTQKANVLSKVPEVVQLKIKKALSDIWRAKTEFYGVKCTTTMC